MYNVDIFLFEGVDELDFCAPFDILASCRKVVNGHFTDRKVFKVETVAESLKPVHASNGLKLLPDRQMDLQTKADIVIVPGGPGSRRDHLSNHVRTWLDYVSETTQLLCSVCTGVFILGRAGLIDGHTVTTHSAYIDTLHQMYPKAVVEKDVRYVADGPRLLTSAGISSGIDVALYIIQRFEGRQAAELAAKRLQWPLPIK